MAPINVGLIGYGFATKSFHLPFILPNPDLNVYAFLQRAAPPTEKDVKPGVHCTVDYPDAKHYRTADDFFADPDIELVIVCTQHESHADLAERSIKAGKHGIFTQFKRGGNIINVRGSVVVEKPFTITTAEADHLLKLAEGSDKILTDFQSKNLPLPAITPSNVH